MKVKETLIGTSTQCSSSSLNRILKFDLKFDLCFLTNGHCSYTEHRQHVSYIPSTAIDNQSLLHYHSNVWGQLCQFSLHAS